MTSLLTMYKTIKGRVKCQFSFRVQLVSYRVMCMLIFDTQFEVKSEQIAVVQIQLQAQSEQSSQI